MQEKELREKLQPLFDTYCCDIREEKDEINKYIFGDLGGREFVAVIMQKGGYVFGFGLGLKDGDLYITQEPDKYAKNIIKNFEKNQLKEWVESHKDIAHFYNKNN